MTVTVTVTVTPHSGAMHRQRPRELFPARGLLVRSNTQNEGPEWHLVARELLSFHQFNKKTGESGDTTDDLDYFC